MNQRMIKALVISVLIVAVLMLSLGQVIKSGIETVAPELLGAEVTVGSVRLSPFTGAATISNLVVGSPAGFSAPQVFSLDEVSVNLSVSSLLSDTIRIQEIRVTAPEITWEPGVGGSNVAALQKNLSDDSASGGSSDGAQTSSSNRGKKVVIDNLYIDDAKVRLAVGGAAAGVPLPPIHLTDIGKEGDGTSFGEAVAEVLAAILGALGSVNLNGFADSMKDASEAVGEGIKALQSLF